MKEQDLFDTAQRSPEVRTLMNGKPVVTVEAKTVLNLQSGFKEKLLCDGPTFTAGSSCAYSCSFCYVPAQMGQWANTAGISGKLEEIVVRRKNAAEILCQQLGGTADKYKAEGDNRVAFCSPLVDPAANMELLTETEEMCRVMLRKTNWQIRILSKSHLLPVLARRLAEYRGRMIYGVSTGTLNDDLAASFERGCPLVSRRIKSLHILQDEGFRTYGMICPSLPQGSRKDYMLFSREMMAAIRADKCEHVWAEVINLRGESFIRTIASLADFPVERQRLQAVADQADGWENYAQDTFSAHMKFAPNGKLRFLQYPRPQTLEWWKNAVEHGAVLLGL